MRTIDNTELSDLARCPWKHAMRHRGDLPEIIHEWFHLQGKPVVVPDSVKWLRPKKMSPAPQFGIDMHAAQEVLHTTQDIEKAVAKFRAIHADPPDEHAYTHVRGELILREYFQRYHDKLFLDGVHEITFEVPLNDDILFTGRIDIRCPNGDDGKHWIVDHKTTSRGTGPSFYLQHKSGRQFSGYVWAEEQLEGGCNGIILDGLFVTKAKSVEKYKQTKCYKDGGWFGRHTIYANELQTRRWRLETVKLVEQRLAGNPFPYHVFEACVDFKQCAYFELCHDAELTPEIWLDTVEQRFVSEKWSPMKEEKKDD